MQFKKVNVFSFSSSERSIEQFKSSLIKLGVEVTDVPEESDLIIVLGGDGTILHNAKKAHQLQVPILGVNTGDLGYLADIELTDLDVIKAILSGHYTEDRRQVLKCEVGGSIYYAVNEVMVNKGKPTRMIKFEVFVNDQFLYEQTADGMIVATATGSSAYALSAGGQLIHPGVPALSLVPVCPSKITSCPIIIQEDSVIEVLLHSWKDSVSELAVDAISVPLNGHNRIKIQKDLNSVTFLHPLHYNYYQNLQHKLNWEVSPIQDRKNQ